MPLPPAPSEHRGDRSWRPRWHRRPGIGSYSRSAHAARAYSRRALLVPTLKSAIRVAFPAFDHEATVPGSTLQTVYPMAPPGKRPKRRRAPISFPDRDDEAGDRLPLEEQPNRPGPLPDRIVVGIGTDLQPADPISGYAAISVPSARSGEASPAVAIRSFSFILGNSDRGPPATRPDPPFTTRSPSRRASARGGSGRETNSPAPKPRDQVVPSESPDCRGSPDPGRKQPRSGPQRISLGCSAGWEPRSNLSAISMHYSERPNHAASIFSLKVS